jgi:cyclopropane fatty-acyl-phospholipid synthase-like methyltransferase
MYDARKYFESKYRATLPGEFSDRMVISPDCDPLFARHHYVSVESGIIEYFAANRLLARPSVFDLGSGAGHWIDFFLEHFEASRVVGVEISERCASELRAKYGATGRVEVVEDDVSRPGFGLGERFDVIVAIGVMFHVVDDAAWALAIQNLSAHLKDGGTIVVGGQFGLRTRDVGFTPLDEFSSWEDFLTTAAPVPLVRKRVRSLHRWRKTARRCGLRVDRVHRTHRMRGIPAPQNNLVFLRPEAGARGGC